MLQLKVILFLLITSSGIYNRFSRNFGGKISWFNFKPENIVTLSKIELTQKKNKITRECLDFIGDSIKAAQVSLI